MNWEDLAQTKGSEVEAPKSLPVGHYQVVITGQPEQKNSAKKNTPYLHFPVVLQEAMDDVDAEELAAAGGLADLGTKYLDFYMTEKTLYDFTNFCERMGINSELHVLEMASELADSQEPFIVPVTHEPNERNPERPYVNFGRPMTLAEYNA